MAATKDVCAGLAEYGACSMCRVATASRSSRVAGTKGKACTRSTANWWMLRICTHSQWWILRIDTQPLMDIQNLQTQPQNISRTTIVLHEAVDEAQALGIMTSFGLCASVVVWQSQFDVMSTLARSCYVSSCTLQCQAPCKRITVHIGLFSLQTSPNPSI